VHPAVCFVNNSPQGGLTNIGGVRVCSDAELHKLFENPLETPLGEGAIAIIAAQLARSMDEKQEAL
jgi:hypothetical protein